MATIRPSNDPRSLLRTFRANYINFFQLWRATGSRPVGAEIYTPDERRIEEEELPQAVRAVVARWRETHSKQTLEFVKHMRTVNGDPVLVIEDERGLPPEGTLLTTSQTVTLNSDDQLYVVTDLYVARIR
jgi:hypothetical protein